MIIDKKRDRRKETGRLRKKDSAGGGERDKGYYNEWYLLKGGRRVKGEKKRKSLILS